ncbi:MAG TPA: hypothetical protein PK951_07130 [Chitinophagaceae bacterium]|nr:hypothetical protein [Chitinophagaceae bacterium]
MKIKTLILFVCTLSSFYAIAQPTQFSMATDVTVVRSFKKDQKFWSIGQTVAGHFHFTKKDGLYLLFTYAGNGKFSNQLNATAKDSATIPQGVSYTNKANLSYRHISVGWRHYLKGAFNAEEDWNLYGYGGFGLMFGRVQNLHSIRIDTSNYELPVLSGEGNFKRLTFDLGLGFEVYAGGNVYFYAEVRTLIATTGYPSRYLFVNNDAPLTGSINLGARILFD